MSSTARAGCRFYLWTAGAVLVALPLFIWYLAGYQALTDVPVRQWQILLLGMVLLACGGIVARGTKRRGGA